MDATQLALEGEFTIFAAQAVKDQLLAALDGGDTIEVNLAGVTEMDSAGLQLLLAAKREAAVRGKTLRLAGHSLPVLELLELTDLSTALGDPLVLPRN